MRVVSSIPNSAGLYELGPCDKADGLGDTLTITPVAAALGGKAVMLLPPKLAHFAFLFAGHCPVRISEDHPVFPWKSKPIIGQKLEVFGLHAANQLPVINVSPEVIIQARGIIGRYNNPIAFCPTCSRHWSHMRQRPPRYWEPVVRDLAKRWTVCQFGWPEYPLLDGARRMDFISLEILAGMYHLIGNYVGVDTGDHHLMLSVGGRCVTAEPDPLPPTSLLWRYKTPRVVYAKLSHSSTALDGVNQIGF